MSWWEQELPSQSEMDEGRDNLKLHNYKVDYIISYCCSTGMQSKIAGMGSYQADQLTDYLEFIENYASYNHWFFGHYHMNHNVDNKHSLLYQVIIPIEKCDNVCRISQIGFPKFQIGDVVKIKWDDVEKIGTINVVDANGTLEQCKEPSYDIVIDEDNWLCKHIVESDIIGLYLE